jgi:flagellar basal body-associated protein FliL
MMRVDGIIIIVVVGVVLIAVAIGAFVFVRKQKRKAAGGVSKVSDVGVQLLRLTIVCASSSCRQTALR